MYKIRYAGDGDKSFWFNVDSSIDEITFENKVQNYMAYIFEEDLKKIGILRYSLFGDNIPFCNLLCIAESFRHKGCGRALIRYWENDMRSRRYTFTMVSSYIDGDMYAFYRKMGYREAGGIVIPNKFETDSTRLLMIKQL